MEEAKDFLGIVWESLSKTLKVIKNEGCNEV